MVAILLAASLIRVHAGDDGALGCRGLRAPADIEAIAHARGAAAGL